MNKFSKLIVTLVASLGIAGATTVAINQTPALPTVQAASTENLDLANRDITGYIDNCQQYESSDKQFRGFTVSSRSPTPASTPSGSMSTTTSSS